MLAKAAVIGASALTVAALATSGGVEIWNGVTEPAATTWPIKPGDSWSAAYKNASPGDTILLSRGTYPAITLTRDPNKDNASKNVIFQGQLGVVVGGFTTGASGGSGNTEGASHFELRDVDIRGVTKLTYAHDIVISNPGDFDPSPQSSGNSLVISGSQKVTVKGGEYGPTTNSVNHINRCGSNPVCPADQDILIDSVLFHDSLISTPEPHSECLMIWGNGSEDVTLRNVVMRNCTDFSLFVKGSGMKNIHIEGGFYDAPMPGDVATTECNPDCRRGGSAIRFSKDGASNFTYPGSTIINNTIAPLGSIAVDNPAGMTITGNVTGAIPVWPPTGPPPIPTDTVPTDTTPTETQPTEPTPTETTPTETVPTDTTPTDTIPTDTTPTYPTDTTPTETVPTETVPTQPTDTQPTDTIPLPPLPAAPSIAVVANGNTVTVSWDPVAGAAGYRFLIDNVAVSSTKDPTRTSVKFGLKPGEHVYSVASLSVEGTEVSGFLSGVAIVK